MENPVHFADLQFFRDEFRNIAANITFGSRHEETGLQDVCTVLPQDDERASIAVEVVFLTHLIGRSPQDAGLIVLIEIVHCSLPNLDEHPFLQVKLRDASPGFATIT